jgi:hypothetical protein
MFAVLQNSLNWSKNGSALPLPLWERVGERGTVS